MSSNQNDSRLKTSEQSVENNDSDWGWENIGDTADDIPNAASNEADAKLHDLKPVKSMKSFDSKQIALKVAADSLKSGMTSSPSFQELERAIGATLAQSMHGSDSDMAVMGRASMPKLGSFNSIYQRAQNQQKVSRQVRNNNSKSVRDELSEFIRESESRALILFHSPDILPNAVRDACQSIGALYYIRPEFHNRGVTFLSYFDLRSAATAIDNLPKELGIAGTASAHYSVMLHGTANNCEEHRLIIRHLPSSIVETELESVFSRYGEVRSIERKQILESPDGSTGLSEPSNVYFVEYFNIQDSRSAASELGATSSQMWGPSASISFCPLTQHKQNLLRQLLSILSRWRSEAAPVVMSHNIYNRPSPYYSAAMSSQIYPPTGYGYPIPVDGSMDMSRPPNGYNLPNYVMRNGTVMMQSGGPVMGGYQDLSGHQHMDPQSYARNNHMQQQSQQTQHHMMGMSVAPSASTYRSQSTNSSETSESNAKYSNANTNQSSGINTYPNTSTPNGNHSKRIIHSTLPPSSSTQTFRNVTESRPQHHNGGSQSHSLRRPKPANGMNSSDVEFALDLERITNHQETRTTVMVRNIPNKYTQRMLLDEVDVHHRGTYDFFYLPIDFKNRCNVGYCFINFLDPSYIVGFVQEFNGHRWKNFNSEKVCAVTFARIQGKAAMISRFQNSSLLEKHDDYKPLLFYSNGPDRGKPEPFPSSARFKHNPKDAGYMLGDAHMGSMSYPDDESSHGYGYEGEESREFS